MSLATDDPNNSRFFYLEDITELMKHLAPSRMTQVSQEGIEGIGQEGARLSQATLDEIRSRLFRQAKARRLGFQALYTNTRRAAIRQFLTHLEDALYPLYRSIESLEEHHTERILSAFRRHRVMNIHFNPSTGYGYHDLGRETLENVYAAVWGARWRSCDSILYPGRIRSRSAYLRCCARAMNC